MKYARRLGTMECRFWPEAATQTLQILLLKTSASGLELPLEVHDKMPTVLIAVGLFITPYPLCTVRFLPGQQVAFSKISNLSYTDLMKAKLTR